MSYKAPDRIWLQVEDGYDIEFGECITWCEDKINDTDVEYIRADTEYLEDSEKEIMGALRQAANKKPAKLKVTVKRQGQET